MEQRAVFADLDWPRLRQWEDGAAAQGLSWERYAGRVSRDVLVALLSVFTELFAAAPLGARVWPALLEILNSNGHMWNG